MSKKPKGYVSGARTPGWAYCGACGKNVRHTKLGRCKTCGKPIWELQAELNGKPLRTTKETYRKLMEFGSDE